MEMTINDVLANFEAQERIREEIEVGEKIVGFMIFKAISARCARKSKNTGKRKPARRGFNGF